MKKKATEPRALYIATVIVLLGLIAGLCLMNLDTRSRVRELKSAAENQRLLTTQTAADHNKVLFDQLTAKFKTNDENVNLIFQKTNSLYEAVDGLAMYSFLLTPTETQYRNAACAAGLKLTVLRVPAGKC